MKKMKTLEECFGTLSQETIDNMYNELPNDLKSKKKQITKKDKIESLVADTIASYMVNSFTFTDKEVNQIKDLIEGKNIKNISEKIKKNNFVFKINNTYIVPDEINKMYQYNKETNQNHQKKLIIMQFYLLANGVLEISKLIELFNASGIKITKTEITKLAKENDYIIFKDLIYFDSLAKDLDEELSMHEHKKQNNYREFHIEEIIAIQTEIESENYEKKISKILSSKIKNKNNLDRYTDTIRRIINVGYEYQNNIEDLLESEKILLSEKNKEALFELADEIYWYFPSWELNGYCEAELSEENDLADINFEDLSPKEQVEAYINVYLTLNGIISIDKLLEILTTNHNLKITKTDLIKIASNVEEITIFQNYLCIKDAEELLEEMMPIKNNLNKYKIIEDIDEMLGELLEITSNLTDIGFKYNLDEEMVMGLEQIMQMGGIDANILSMILKDEGYSLSPQKQKELLKELLAVQKNVRMWIINGFKKSELTNINKKAKIGRNDKCSCGSGKKYKQCCGK